MARRGADVLADAIRAGVGDVHLAVSGGTTPRRMFALLAGEELAWARVHLWQVDERDAPAGDPARNRTLLEASGLAARCRFHPMPVESGDAAAYARELAGVRFDVVHLGMGADGHTASLVPGDPVLAEDHADVALTGPYQGRRRMTLTYPVLDRARTVLFVVTGADKAAMVARLVRRDPAIPAGRVTGQRALIMADAAAAGGANA